ncbi:MAG: hypothetical protein OXK74_15295 [Gemmatimonadota bacterium]|nr:hypothetical protein [Gemmatimonadota bacterium]
MLVGADNIGASTPGTGETRPARPTREAGRCRGLRAACLVGAILAMACDESEPGWSDSATWLTEAEYKLSGDPDRDVFFSQVPVLRVDPHDDRVFVLDVQDTELSVWTPEGSLAFVLGGKGEGPGEFTYPTRVEFVNGGSFYVREGWGSRFTYYAADGALAGTEAGAPTSLMYQDYGLQLEATTGNGGYFAVPLIGMSVFADRGIDRYPILRVERSDEGEWRAPEPVFWVDGRNTEHPIELGGDRTMWAVQVFGDSDLTWFEPGSVMVGRRTGGAGVIELFELDAEADTVWVRQLRFEPQTLTAETIRKLGDEFAAHMTIPGVSPRVVRQAWEEHLYRPEYLPAAKGIVLTASGEVWLKTFERSDTLAVYYAIRRGDMTGQPRRVLIPESVSLHDATETHVWGIWEDPLGVPHVVGRRLVPVP